MQEQGDLLFKIRSRGCVLDDGSLDIQGTDGYISVSAIFILSGWQIVSVRLSVVQFNERHTGVNIASAVQSMICEYNISQAAAVALVHGQASNMTVAGRDLENSLPNFSSVVCAVHRIQNSLKQGLQISIVSKLLAKGRKLVAHFNQGVRATTALHLRQVEMKMKKLNVVQDVSTRWNSSLRAETSLIAACAHNSGYERQQRDESR